LFQRNPVGPVRYPVAHLSLRLAHLGPSADPACLSAFGQLLTVNSCIKVRLWLASGQVSRHSQGTLLPSSGEPKVSNPWNKCVTQKLI
jgi:hypothetical protein